MRRGVTQYSGVERVGRKIMLHSVDDTIQKGMRKERDRKREGGGKRERVVVSLYNSRHFVISLCVCVRVCLCLRLCLCVCARV